MNEYFVFTIENRQYAVSLSVVEKVIRAVELIPVPDGPDILLGLLNMRGAIIPVINIRRSFRLKPRNIGINDRIIISRIDSCSVAFIADTVEGVVTFSKDNLDKGDQILPKMDHYIEGVGKIGENTVLIYDIEKLISDQRLET